MFKRQTISGILLLVGLILVSCAPATEATEQPAVLPTDPSPESHPTEQPIIEPSDEPISESGGRITFEQLGISLEIPADLVVIKEPVYNLDDPSKLDSYLFYIRNYSPAEGPGENYFQIYGHLQYSIPSTTWEEFAPNVLDSDMYAYAEEIEVNGLRGLNTQLTGQRNRFVYFFLLDGHVLNLAVSEPTETNKALADQIINTLLFTPGIVTDASKID